MADRFVKIARTLWRISCTARPTDLEPEFALDPADAAEGLALVLRTNLGPVERLILAEGAIQALDGEDAAELAESVINDTGHGWPIPHPQSFAAEAAGWADGASRAELVAMFASVWNRLDEMDKAEFLKVAA